MRLGTRPTVTVVPPHIPTTAAAGTEVDDTGTVRFTAATRHALASQRRQALARQARQARDRGTAISTASRSDERQALPARATPQQIAQRLLAARGWSGQYGCLLAMWTRESSWNPYAQNPSSGAYGIPQALPGSKMAAFGADWRTNPQTQIEWGLWYIRVSYGTPCGAWAFWQAHNYY
jgi:hypothetical protein